MANVETRQVDRDSLLLMAQVRVDGSEAEYRVKVRNLSAGGMMAEGDSKVVRGSLVAVELRNIGWVDGSVAWKQDERFGIAFVQEIDPRVPRALTPPSGPDMIVPRFVRQGAEAASPVKLRKI
jgi:prepilin-type processing-associated H-X9-DG protein